jgi:hypothetical protein
MADGAWTSGTTAHGTLHLLRTTSGNNRLG